MFLEGPTIGFNGFSMVFEILRAMVNDGLEVNNGLHIPSHKKVQKTNLRQNANFKLPSSTWQVLRSEASNQQALGADFEQLHQSSLA